MWVDFVIQRKEIFSLNAELSLSPCAAKKTSNQDLFPAAVWPRLDTHVTPWGADASLGVTAAACLISRSQFSTEMPPTTCHIFTQPSITLERDMQHSLSVWSAVICRWFEHKRVTWCWHTVLQWIHTFTLRIDQCQFKVVWAVCWPWPSIDCWPKNSLVTYAAEEAPE